MGWGRTLEMSSREVSFTTQQPLRLGDMVWLAIDGLALGQASDFLAHYRG